ncbi:MAG: hypothetical protein DRQ49_14165 [Gammaproteobacteria bacterium]|nr:MAG: hypothetical protein DRQ41_13765 [Gammaproteobacteria bacterium]RKZ38488.1 MAG: hypothetical protein DRQ49_14165 [Gammaproteobacteria bacterium]RKZ77432.1 MAG: hypothetical protein DRQ57_00295 [Gammaproteobacteria bacterium]
MNDKQQSLILIVDDNPLNLQVLEHMLKRGGYKTVQLHNGQQAMDYFVQPKTYMKGEYQTARAQNSQPSMDFVQKKQPDLILLDIMMPGIDGIEVCRQFKKKESTRNIPVIFITALSGTDDKLKAFEAGGVDYMTKPFIPEEVLARINIHIELKRAMEQLKKMSVTDEMTGVFNRRWAYEILVKQIEIAKREGSSFIVCYVDIDHLKIINDTYGHAEGDILINTVVNSFKEVIRTSDYIFRMGGDEFLLLFPQAKLQESDNLIKRLRNKLCQQKINGFPIDFSFGFSQFRVGDTLSPDELIKMADSDMYDAKTKKKAILT